MNIKHKASHGLVCGKSGMGKTTFGVRYINGSHHARVFIYDHEGEFWERLQIPYERVARDFEELITLAETNRIVPFDYGAKYPTQKIEAFEEFCTVVHSIAQFGFCPKNQSCLMVTDELQKFVNAQYSPDSFKNIMETGRREMLDTLSLTRAPNRVNAATREEFTELVLFRLDDVNSLKFAEGVGADVEKVKTLREHEFLYYNVVKGHARDGKVEFTKRATV